MFEKKKMAISSVVEHFRGGLEVVRRAWDRLVEGRQACPGSLERNAESYRCGFVPLSVNSPSHARGPTGEIIGSTPRRLELTGFAHFPGLVMYQTWYLTCP